MSDATQAVTRASGGDRRALDELVPLVYDELRKRAAAFFRREKRDHTLQPTALVHEAFVRLVDQTRVDWKGRTHFLAVAAIQMRRVLADHAKARNAAKRGKGWLRVDLGDLSSPESCSQVEMPDLIAAVEALAALNARQARIVELRIFGGLGLEEVAETLGWSPKTVEKDWRMARAWLRRRLGEEHS